MSGAAGGWAIVGTRADAGQRAHETPGERILDDAEAFGEIGEAAIAAGESLLHAVDFFGEAEEVRIAGVDLLARGRQIVGAGGGKGLRFAEGAVVGDELFLSLESKALGLAEGSGEIADLRIALGHQTLDLG